MNLHVHTKNKDDGKVYEFVFNPAKECIEVRYVNSDSIPDSPYIGSAIAGVVSADEAETSAPSSLSAFADYQLEDLILMHYCLVLIHPDHDEPFMTPPVFMARQEKPKSDPPNDPAATVQFRRPSSLPAPSGSDSKN